MMLLCKLFCLAMIVASMAGCGGHNEIIRSTETFKPPGTDAGGPMSGRGFLKPTAPQK